MNNLQQDLGLSKKPIAIGFYNDEAPVGVEQWERRSRSGGMLILARSVGGA